MVVFITPFTSVLARSRSACSRVFSWCIWNS